MKKFIPIVKNQVSWFLEQSERFPPSHPRHRPDKVAMYRRLAMEFGELLAAIERASDTELSALPPTSTTIHRLAPTTDLGTPAPTDALDDLPPELLAELSADAARGENDPLINVINERGGTATLDEILIDLYRKHRQINKRVLVSNKLYRLAKRGLIWVAPGKKGVYATRPFESETVVTLFDKAKN